LAKRLRGGSAVIRPRRRDPTPRSPSGCRRRFQRPPHLQVGEQVADGIRWYVGMLMTLRSVGHPGERTALDARQAPMAGAAGCSACWPHDQRPIRAPPRPQDDALVAFEAQRAARWSMDAHVGRPISHDNALGVEVGIVEEVRRRKALADVTDGRSTLPWSGSIRSAGRRGSPSARRTA